MIFELFWIFDFWTSFIFFVTIFIHSEINWILFLNHCFMRATILKRNYPAKCCFRGIREISCIFRRMLTILKKETGQNVFTCLKRESHTCFCYLLVHGLGHTVFDNRKKNFHLPKCVISLQRLKSTVNSLTIKLVWTYFSERKKNEPSTPHDCQKKVFFCRSKRNFK